MQMRFRKKSAVAQFSLNENRKIYWGSYDGPKFLLELATISGPKRYMHVSLSPHGRQSNLKSRMKLNSLSIYRYVMEESYKYQGATIHTYKTVYGAEGKYSTLLKYMAKRKTHWVIRL